jgi:hypothetical protein
MTGRGLRSGTRTCDGPASYLWEGQRRHRREADSRLRPGREPAQAGVRVRVPSQGCPRSHPLHNRPAADTAAPAAAVEIVGGAVERQRRRVIPGAGPSGERRPPAAARGAHGPGETAAAAAAGREWGGGRQVPPQRCLGQPRGRESALGRAMVRTTAVPDVDCSDSAWAVPACVA